MSRFSQTIARVATGFACLGSLAWLLWPSDLSLLKNPEALFVFATAIVVWIAAELKYSQEVGMRQSSPNDIRVGKEMLTFHGANLRFILKDHDTFQFADSIYYQVLDEISDRRARQRLLFQDSVLDQLLHKFEIDARSFH